MAQSQLFDHDRVSFGEISFVMMKPTEDHGDPSVELTKFPPLLRSDYLGSQWENTQISPSVHLNPSDTDSVFHSLDTLQNQDLASLAVAQKVMATVGPDVTASIVAVTSEAMRAHSQAAVKQEEPPSCASQQPTTTTTTSEDPKKVQPQSQPVAATTTTTSTLPTVQMSETRDPLVAAAIYSVAVVPAQPFSPNSVLKRVFWDVPITSSTPISVLEGIDEMVAETLQEQAKISTLSDFAKLPSDFATVYSFLLATNLVPDLDKLIENTRKLLETAKRDPVPQIDQSETIDPLPFLRDLEELKENNTATWIEKNAYVWTLGQLSRFDEEFPGIYSQLKSFGSLHKLDHFIECSRKLVDSKFDFSWLDLEQNESISELRLDVIYTGKWRKSVKRSYLLKSSFDLAALNLNTPISVLAGLPTTELKALELFSVKTIEKLASLRDDRELFAKCRNTDSEDKVKTHHPGAFTEHDEKLLAALAVKIDEKSMQVKTSPESGFFVKMASRSAKDVVLSSPKFLKMVGDSLSKYKDIEWDTCFETDVVLRDKVLTGNHEDDVISSNKQMLEFIRCTVKVLETFSGKVAISTFINSARTYGDLKQRELLGDDFSMDICLREWHPDLIPEFEFRAFVNRGKLTCITQYYPWVYSQEMNQKKDEIEKRMVEFWETICPLFPIDTYAIDFAVLPEKINPPAPLAGSSLFDWPRDRDIIENGPFEFRIQTEVVLDVKDRIYVKAVELMNKKFPNYRKLELLHKEQEDMASKRKSALNKGGSEEDAVRFSMLAAVAVLAIGALYYSWHQRY